MQLFFKQSELEAICAESFQMATGRKAMLAKTGQLAQSPYRLLIQIGLLGPAFGGQCILDFPLLTALNLCALQLTGQNFSSLSQQNTVESLQILKQLLGLPQPQYAETYRCHNAWVKRIEINLGPLYQHEIMRLAVVEQQGQAKELRIQIGPEKEEVLALDPDQRAEYTLEGRRFLFQVQDALSVKLQLDESDLTLGPVPPDTHEGHILTQIEGKHFLVKSGSSLVKSSLLEIANQVSPALIPSHLVGDISTPKLIPSRAAHLPLPDMKRYHVEILLMGAGPIRVKLELGHLSSFSERQLDILKRLFDYTFYHPELKKLFG